MKRNWNEMKMFFCIGAIILLLFSAFQLVRSTTSDSDQDDFVLPPRGGGMVHCDPQLTDNIRLSVPTTNVGMVWYSNTFGGENYGTFGNGIAGNGRIAASSFGMPSILHLVGQNDNLIIYDYYGNRLWSSGYWHLIPYNDSEYPWSLNPSTCGSVPMIDINDRVVACDYQKIILVNASNHSNVHVNWTSYFPEVKHPLLKILSLPVPISPTIVENRTIIVPTLGGPLYAFDVKTGARIASLTFLDNSTNESFYGECEMNWSDFMTIMSDPLDCPYHYNSSSQAIEWNSTVPYGIMPITPVFFEGTIMFLTDRDGSVAAIDLTTGSLLANNSLRTPELITGGRLYGTQNSACVKGNRVYITTQFPPPKLSAENSGNVSGRLYAVDVNPDAENPSDILEEAWNFSFPGQCQASPTLINDTIYFDGFNGSAASTNGSNRDPHIYAVYTNGTMRWKRSYPNTTGFSFSMDPRGGFWYEDTGAYILGGGGRKLVHFDENGNIIENISLQTLLGDPLEVFPCSCMVICGTADHPIMVVSANHRLWLPFTGSWVVAINLSDNNSLLWKVRADCSKTLFGFNYPSGLYTILKENNESRILFSTFLGGIMAVGTFPDCWFHDIDSQLTDSSTDTNTYYDKVQVNYTIQTAVNQDQVTIKTLLYPVDLRYRLLYRYRVEQKYTVTPNGTQGSLNISLPKNAPKGLYRLHVYALNSSGDFFLNKHNASAFERWEDIKEMALECGIDIDAMLQELLDVIEEEFPGIYLLLQKLDRLTEFYREFIKPIIIDLLGIYIYSDAHYQPSLMYLHPPNDQPDQPEKPDGPTIIKAEELQEYTTRTEDPNYDQVKYRWKWSLVDYSCWSELRDSGEWYTKSHAWIFPGFHLVSARARDSWNSPNVVSTWSPSKLVWVTPGGGSSCPDEVIVGQSYTYEGISYGLTEPVNWTWTITYGERASKKYFDRIMYYSFAEASTENQVDLKITDSSDPPVIVYCNNTVASSFVIAGFNTSSMGAQPTVNITFNDTSMKNDTVGELSWWWDFDDGNTSSDRNTSHAFNECGLYNVTLNVTDGNGNASVCSQWIYVETTSPVILSAPCSTYTVAGGENVTIYADFFENQSEISTVILNIICPDNTSMNYSMNSSSGEYDFEYNFTNTTQAGIYLYNIVVVDHANNSNWCAGLSFEVLPLAFVPPTPESGAWNNGSIPVNITSLTTDRQYVFTDFNHDLALWMRMDDVNDSGHPVDLSRYGNNGTKYADANRTDDGMFGDAFEFDGSGDYIKIDDTGTNLDFVNTNRYTWSVWLKFGDFPKSQQGFLSKDPPSAKQTGFNFCLNETGDTGDIVIYRYPGWQHSDGLNLELEKNTWVHAVIVYNGSAGWDIYINGTYQGTVTLAVSSDTTGMYFIGAGTKSTGPQQPDYFFNGLLDEVLIFNRALNGSEIQALYNATDHSYSHTFVGLDDGWYNFTGYGSDVFGWRNETETRQVIIDTVEPILRNVSNGTGTFGFGYSCNITAEVLDNGSGVDQVVVNVTYPDASTYLFTMDHGDHDIYGLVFNDTWLIGQYNYSVMAYDNATNSNTSGVYSFNVSVNAIMSIATLESSYSGSEFINLTDPPNPLENLTLVDRGLDWNRYYNDVTGEETLEVSAGPINYQNMSGEWMAINTTLQLLDSEHPAYQFGYRVGNDRGLYNMFFKPNIQSTWPVAFAYNKSDDPTVHVLRSQLVGVGYVDPSHEWEHIVLQGVQSSQGEICDDSVLYEDVFTGADVMYSYRNMGVKEDVFLSNTTKEVLMSHPPSLYGLENGSSFFVVVTKMDLKDLRMFNGTGELLGNFTVTEGGVDLRDGAGRFVCSLPLGEAYEQYNMSVSHRLMYRFVHQDGEWFVLVGLPVGDLLGMQFPVVIDPTELLYSVYSSTSDGYISGSASSYSSAWSASTGTVTGTSDTIMIGQYRFIKTFSVFRGFLFFNTSTLPSYANVSSATLSLYKASDYSTTDFTITIQNGQPVYPHDPLESGDYDKTYYSGYGGGLNTTGFVNGRNSIELSNMSWVTKEGMTKLCLRSSRDINGTQPSGNEYVYVYSKEKGTWYAPQLTITYRYQSKIKNTGTTNISGYLLIQVHFYNVSQEAWVMDNDTVNETFPRTILAGDQLGLDTIFNGLVRASDLVNGVGDYRVYAAFRSPTGEILVTDDEQVLSTEYSFTYE